MEWDGGTGTRILVRLDWRRRRFGRLAALPVLDDADIEVDVAPDAEWRGRYAPPKGPMGAGRLAGLYLPWLPADAEVTLTGGPAGTMTVRREGDRLVDTHTDGGVAAAGRWDGVALLCGTAGGAAERPAPLEVTRQQQVDSEYRSVPLDADECVELLRRMPPRTDSWLSCLRDGAGVVQMAWEAEGLWLESPDPARRASAGRIVSVAEAERMIRALADENRVAVEDLGDLTTTPWD